MMPTCPSCNANLNATDSFCPSCGSAVADAPDRAVALPLNTRLKGGAFVVKEVLGQGGFGITYKGGDMALRRYVAIKEFFPFGSHRSGTTLAPPQGTTQTVFNQARDGFIKEAMTLARFNHPGIVRVFGAFEENNSAYMVMELLEGQSLQEILNRKGVLAETDALRVVTHVGEALGAVHTAGLLHRDVKPDNIILLGAGTPEERSVLIDFGTAREFSAGKTKNMTAMVTQGYAPLEQYGTQARFGPYTDIHALGATLYHCLTGVLPTSAMDRLAGVDLQPPDRVNPNVSRATSDAVMWALEIKAMERPQSVSEWIEALRSGKTPHSQNTAVPAPLSPTAVPLPPAAPTPTPQAPTLDTSGVTFLPPHPTSPTRGNQQYAESCPHCGAGMSGVMTICPSCLKKKTAPVGTTDTAFGKPDSLFDTVMFAIPTAVWYLAGLSIVLLVGGRITLGVVRYQNGSRDFGKELAAEVMDSPKAQPLTEAELELGEETYDAKELVNRHDNYVGKVRYRDGDAGSIALTVTDRDWLYRPEKYEFSFTPTDFGPRIAGMIEGELNEKLREDGGTGKISSITVNRVTRTIYQGSFTARVGRESFDGRISVTVESFDADGGPATWSYNVS